MFVLRQAHLDAFVRAAAESFEDRTLAWLREEFPAHCDELGEVRLQATVLAGEERAGEYEIDTQRDVADFIRLMFAIAPDFDRARKTSWAREILEETWVSGATRLHEIRLIAQSKGMLRSEPDAGARGIAAAQEGPETPER